MVLVFILLGILIIITLIVFLIFLSNTRISFENFDFTNMEEKTVDKIVKYNSVKNKELNIRISLVLFKKFTWFFINLNKDKLNKIAKKANFNKNMLKKFEQDFKLSDLKILKELKPKISKLNLNIKFGLEDVIITSYLVIGISVLISNILPFVVEKENYNKCKYNVEPIYLNKNLYKISLNCIIEEKMVHIINILFKFLKKGRSDKNERTSNRRSYDYSNEQFAKYG